MPSSEERVQRIGIALTVVIVLFFLESVTSYFGMLDDLGFQAHEFGDTVAGFSSALAFVWLVVGYHLQRHELALNTKAIQDQVNSARETASQLERQSKIITESQEFIKRDAVLRLIKFREEEIEYNTVSCVRRSYRFGGYLEDRIKKLGGSIDDHCIWIFSNLLFQEQKNIEWLSQDEFQIYINRIISAFRSAQVLSEDIPDGEVVLSRLENGVCGELYLRCCEYRRVDPKFRLRGRE